MTFNPKIKFTVRDYMTTPEDKRYELIEGELLVAPSPNTTHQRISRRLLRLLSDFVEARELGEVFSAPYDVILSEHDVLQPDILFVSREHAGIITDRVRGAPDLVVEVLSAGSEERDRVAKRALYERYGVREYWIVDPEAQSVEVLTWGQEGFVEAGSYTTAGTLNSPLLPGLTISVSQLFARK